MELEIARVAVGLEFPFLSPSHSHRISVGIPMGMPICAFSYESAYKSCDDGDGINGNWNRNYTPTPTPVHRAETNFPLAILTPH